MVTLHILKGVIKSHGLSSWAGATEMQPAGLWATDLQWQGGGLVVVVVVLGGGGVDCRGFEKLNGAEAGGF